MVFGALKCQSRSPGSEVKMEFLKDVYLWAILGCATAGMLTCFIWGYVMGMARVEIEEEESHI